MTKEFTQSITVVTGENNKISLSDLVLNKFNQIIYIDKCMSIQKKFETIKNIKNKCFLIIDDPENSLHPKYQLKLVKLLVQLYKELHIIIFITSNSPFIVEGLEVFTKKEGLEEDINFYLCENKNFTKVLREDLKVIYDNLSNPFREINNVRFENEINDLE